MSRNFSALDYTPFYECGNIESIIALSLNVITMAHAPDIWNGFNSKTTLYVPYGMVSGYTASSS